MNRAWKEFKEQYIKLFPEDADIVDSLAVIDILRLSAEGMSNEDIGEVLDLDTYYIKETLIEFLGFPGWKITLDYSPIEEYNRGMNNTLMEEEICRTYTEIKRKVDDYYART